MLDGWGDIFLDETQQIERRLALWRQGSKAREEEARSREEQSRYAYLDNPRERKEKLERDRIALIKKMRAKCETDAEAMHKLIEERKIHYLVHFTHITNLPGILENGILPRSTVGEDANVNDMERFEGLPEASCLSITFPNYKMFMTCHQKKKNNWAVLLISPRVMLEKPCLFFVTNAAARESRNAITASAESLMGVQGLERLFDPHPDISRELLKLRSSETTDPQAEVLVFDVIEPGCINTICLPMTNMILKEQLSAYRPGISVRSCKGLFDPRADYAFWNNHKRMPYLHIADVT